MKEETRRNLSVSIQEFLEKVRPDLQRVLAEHGEPEADLTFSFVSGHVRGLKEIMTLEQGFNKSKGHE